MDEFIFEDEQNNKIQEEQKNKENVKKENSEENNFIFLDSVEVIKNRQNMYKIIKYTKENSEKMFIDVDKILLEEKYEGNPKNDLTVLLGYLRQKCNISIKEYQKIEKLLNLDPTKINPILDVYNRLIYNFIMNEESNITSDTDKDISNIMIDKNINQNLNIDKEKIIKDLNSFIEVGYVWNNENEEISINLINKNEIINYWGKNYSLYYSNYKDFEKMLMNNNILKYTNKYTYVKSKDSIEIIKEKIKEKTLNIDISLIENLLKNTYQVIDVYKYKEEEYYQIYLNNTK